MEHIEWLLVLLHKIVIGLVNQSLVGLKHVPPGPVLKVLKVVLVGEAMDRHPRHVCQAVGLTIVYVSRQQKVFTLPLRELFEAKRIRKFAFLSSASQSWGICRSRVHKISTTLPASGDNTFAVP